MAVLAEFGIESVGEVMDPDPALALDDAVRAHEPGEVLLSCLLRHPLRAHPQGPGRVGAGERIEPETKLTHIPVRIDDDSIRWDVIHTLVVATQTVATPDLVNRLKERAADRPHRYTIICPRSDDVTEAEIVRDLASTLAELYRADIDATGQPMSPDPFHAVKNAIEHYRIDEVLISTFAGEGLALARGRPDRPRPRDHREAGRAHRGRPAGGRRRRRRRGGEGPDGERDRSPRPRRGAPRPARGQPELADRPPDARDPALHRLRGDAVRGLLRLLLLPPRRRQPARLAAAPLRAAGRRSPASTRRSWSPPASRSTTRWSRSAAATATA